MTRLASRSIAIAAALLVLGTGCGTSEDGAQSTAYLQTALRSRSAMTRSYAYAEVKSVRDFFPDRTVKLSDGTVGPASQYAIVGRVEAVEKGFGYQMDPKDGPDGVRQPFDDEGAAWKTLTVRVRPETVLTAKGLTKEAQPMEFGLAVPGDFDFERGVQGFRDLGQVAVLLKPSSAFPDQPDALGVLFDGEAIGIVEKDGTVAFPFAGEFLDAAPTENESVRLSWFQP